MKLFYCFTVLVSLLLSDMTSAATIPMNGPNCGISVPPPASGEMDMHGNPVRIFPRAINLGEFYNGCQVMWMQVNARWEKLMRVYYVNGKVRFVSIPASLAELSKKTVCEYRESKLISEGKSACDSSPSDFERLKSYAPGCYVRFRANELETDDCSKME